MQLFGGIVILENAVFRIFTLSEKPQYYILAVVCCFGIHRPIRTVSRFCSFKLGDKRAITLGGERSILLSYGDICGTKTCRIIYLSFVSFFADFRQFDTSFLLFFFWARPIQSGDIAVGIIIFGRNRQRFGFEFFFGGGFYKVI